jgi:hypothetical protein
MRRALLLLLAPVLLTAAPPLTIEWEATPTAFAGKKARVKFENGGGIIGVWLGVTPTAFTIDVDYAWGKNPLKRGVHTIDRTAIVELRMQERQVGGRVTGTIVGFLTGHVLGYGVGSAAGAGAIVLAVTIAGHALGAVSDMQGRKVLIIAPANPPELPLAQEGVPESQALPEPMTPGANEGEQEL